jgi:predicted TIM-barrel fold metal-dependent hydrolase
MAERRRHLSGGKLWMSGPVDVSAFLGPYPFREAPGTTPEALLAAMDRTGIREAWVSYLPTAFGADPAEGNVVLYGVAGRERRLRPVPAVHPGREGWQAVVREAVDRGAPAVRCDPTFAGLDPGGTEMRALTRSCGEARLPLIMAVRFEDPRQRDPADVADELPPSAVRALIRSHPALRLLVTHAGRDFIEEVHFGSTPAEAERILWDIAWVWGPPEDHLALLLRTVGLGRFAFGTGQPLRLPEASVAKLDLLDLAPEERGAIESGNLAAWR